MIEHLPSVYEALGSLPQHQLTDTLHTHIVCDLSAGFLTDNLTEAF